MNFEQFCDKLPKEYFAVKCKSEDGHANVFWKKYPKRMPKYIGESYRDILTDLGVKF